MTWSDPAVVNDGGEGRSPGRRLALPFFGVWSLTQRVGHRTPSLLMRDYAIDPRRVFIAGLSAGGAAAAIMGDAYPDL